MRFAEEEPDKDRDKEKDEGVPLGYVLRIKQKREEKARFLQAERERRKHEDERRKHEEERRRWEEERARWEREKRAMEEAEDAAQEEEIAVVLMRMDVLDEGQESPVDEGGAEGTLDPPSKEELDDETNEGFAMLAQIVLEENEGREARKEEDEFEDNDDDETKAMKLGGWVRW